MKTFVILCAIFLFFHSVYGVNHKDSVKNDTANFVFQQKSSLGTEEIPHLVSVSPNAASLGLYGAIPVGHYTGTANISIPLYEIELGGKKFPIELTYHSSGIKVSQEASNVGLGWNLKFGGSIIKDIRGIDDFQSAAGYYFDTNMPRANSDNQPDLTQFNNIGALEVKFDTYYRGYKDAEPDLFYFNVANYSGSAFFNKINTGNNDRNKAYPIVQKISNYLYIEYDLKSKHWIIIDGDGFKYYFGSTETTRTFRSGIDYHANMHPRSMKRNNIYYYEPYPEGGSITAWHLDSIVSPQQQKIIFEYRKEKVYSLIQMTEDVARSIYRTGSPYASFPEDIENYTYYYSILEQLIISTIKTDKEIIRFDTSDRDDLELVEKEGIQGKTKAQKISGISVYDNFTNKFMNSYLLEQSYFGVQSGYEYKRLRLDNIISSKHGGKKFKFTYNTLQLPDKYSNQIDDWGYYNGVVATTNCWGRDPVTGIDLELQTKIPEVTYTIPSFTSFETRKFKGRKRLVSEKCGQACMLNSIEYPTGGITRFTYEPHNLSIIDEETIEKKEVSLAHVCHLNYIPEDDGFPYLGDILNEGFTLTKPVRGGIIRTLLSIGEWANIEGEDPSFFGGCICLYKNGTLLKRVYLLRENYNKLIDYELPTPLQEGNYKFVMYPEMMDSPHKFALSAFVMYDENTTISAKAKGGGLRIKEICNEDNGIITSKKRYNYSDGMLMSRPVFTSKANISSSSANLQEGTAYYLHGKSSPIQPFSNSAMGNPVGYSWVEEKDMLVNAEEDFGYTRYSFHNYPDNYPWEAVAEGVILNGLPGIPDLRNGLSKEVAVYSDEHHLVKRLVYEYEEREELRSVIKGITFNYGPFWSYLMEYNSFQGSNNMLVHDYIKYYDLISGHWDLSCLKEYNYVDGYPVMKETNITYDPINFLPYISETIISKEPGDYQSFTMEHKYISSCFALTPTELNMKEKHMVNLPIESLQLIDNKVVYGKKYAYTYAANMFLNYNIQTLKLVNPVLRGDHNLFYEIDVEFLKYNVKGNPIEVKKSSGLNVVYLWSYKGEYVAAEILGATFNQIKDVLGEQFIINLENKRYPIDADFSVINQLRKSYHVSTYTYDPLIGVTSITGPSENTQYYWYSSDGKLRGKYIIEDDIDKTLEEYYYHYKD